MFSGGKDEIIIKPVSESSIGSKVGLERLYNFLWFGGFLFVWDFEDFFYYNRNSVSFKYSCKERLLSRIRLFILRLLRLFISSSEEM